MSGVVKIENYFGDHDDPCDSKNQILEVTKDSIETSISEEYILGNYDYIEIKSDIKIKNEELIDELKHQKPFIPSVDNNFIVTNTNDSDNLCLKTELNEEFIIKAENSESDKEILPTNSKRKDRYELYDNSSPIPKYPKILVENPSEKDVTEVLANAINYHDELIKNRTITAGSDSVTFDETNTNTGELGDILPVITQNFAGGSNSMISETNSTQISAFGQNANITPTILSSLNVQNFNAEQFYGTQKVVSEQNLLISGTKMSNLVQLDNLGNATATVAKKTMNFAIQLEPFRSKNESGTKCEYREIVVKNRGSRLFIHLTETDEIVDQSGLLEALTNIQLLKGKKVIILDPHQVLLQENSVFNQSQKIYLIEHNLRQKQYMRIRNCIKYENKFRRHPFGGIGLHYNNIEDYYVYLRKKFFIEDDDIIPNICDVCKTTFGQVMQLIRHFNAHNFISVNEVVNNIKGKSKKFLDFEFYLLYIQDGINDFL